MGHYMYASTFPYSAEQLFDLVADVERYPDFLPFWAGVRILRREGDSLRVEQSIRLPLVRLRFLSEAELNRPRRLRIITNQAPFRSLEITWSFKEPKESECLVRLDASYSFRSRHTAALVERFLEPAIRQYVKAFEHRARDVLERPRQ